MAEQGRREVVPDQLAFNAREQAPERSLATIGVRNPGLSGGPTRSASRAMEGLYSALGGVAEAMTDDMITEGKLNNMRGMSEAEAMATGNNFTQQGWQTLGSINKANDWYLGKLEGLNNGDDQLDPDAYKQKLMNERANELANLPDDPAVRKLYVAAFEDKGPALIAKQYEAHMAYNQGKTYNALSEGLYSSSAANTDATRVMPGSTLRVSPTRIDTAIMGNDVDRENGILTLLGEAGGEGDSGMAAVAHVIKNRVTDKRWGGSVTSVVRADKQFSVWNDGGGALNKYRGTAAYDRAGKVYDAVMQGFTADLTNGATNYFAPQGMEGGKNPDWLATESKRSGGTIKIGNHIFAGKSGLAGYVPQERANPEDANAGQQVPGVQGQLVFAHADQTGIDEGFAGILKESAAAMGMPYKITSGYRSPDHPVEKKKKNGGGEHTHKDAADIDLNGMSDEQRKSVIADLRARGVKRFGLYSTSPNMLHVDMNAKGGTSDNYFMYDRSKNNMGKSPKWYQELASSDTGMPLPKGNQPQVRTMLQNVNLSPALKASALADAIRRQADDGSNQLFNDVGGIGILYELGAKPSEIDEVLKSQERMNAKALDAFDTGFERQRSDFLTRVKNGEYPTEESLIAAVDQMHGETRMKDQKAVSLLREAQSELAKTQTGEDAIFPKSFLDATQSVYRKVDSGLMTVDEGYAAVAAAGKTDGIGEKQAQQFLRKVYSVDDAKYARDRSEGETLRKKKLKDDDLKSRTLAAIANGRGGGNIPDGSVDVNGTSMTTKEFGIESVKESIRSTIQVGIANKEIDGKDDKKVAGLFYKTLYTTLAHNDIVDEKGGAAFSASLRGDITTKGPKGELTVKEDALVAFDTYLTMAGDPDISGSYLARMFPDDKVRGLLEQSKRFYANNLDLPTAMMKAQEVIANGTDPNKITNDYYGKVEGKVDEAIKTAIGNDSWWRGVLPAFSFVQPVNDTYEHNLLTNERSKAATYIRSKADAYNAAAPGQDPEVSITLAMQDFQNDMVQVRGQMIIGDYKRGTRIDQKMFTDAPNGQPGGKPLEYDKIAVQDAINHTIELKGKEYWPQWWLQDADRRPGSGAPSMAPVNVTYNPNIGVVGLQYHDKKGKPLGDTIYISAKKIGDLYRYDYLDRPGTLGKMYDQGMDKLVGATRSLGASEAGADVGSLVKPK